MHAFTRFTSVVLGAAAALLLTTSAASAQSLGTFSFALAPYCNNAVMVVTQEGSTYRLAGWDDNCGAVQRFPITGTIAFNLDGTLNISFTTIRTNGIAVDTSIRNFNLGGFTGAWTDSAGNSGTSGIQGLSAPAQTATPRPGPSSTVPSNSVTTVNIVDNSITAVDVDPTQVQLRVSGTCPAGQSVTGVNQNGTVTCGAATAASVGNEVSSVNGITGACEDLDSVAFANAPAGNLSCTAVVTSNFSHTNGTVDHLEFSIEAFAASCGGLQRSVYEMPSEAPTAAGHDISTTVHRWFGAVPAGPITLYLNGKTAGTSANVLASQMTCTVTP